MDFHHLEYFVEIAKENNVTRAAEKLFVSQSAVNQYLLKLEAELGTQLFVRNRRNWRLTEAGEIYLEGCRKALQIRQDTYRRISDITESRSSSLSVGLTPHRGLVMFTDIYPTLHEKYPDLVVIPHELDARAQQQAVDRGELDLSFILNPELPSDRHTFFDMGTEELVVIVPVELDPLTNTEEPLRSNLSDDSVQESSPAGIDILRKETLAQTDFSPMQYSFHGIWGTDSGDDLPVIELSLLRDIPFILTRAGSSGSVLRDFCNRIFSDAGFVPNILMEISTTAHINSIASVCRCCGIIPRYYLDTRDTSMHYYVLPEHPTWHLYITHRKDAYLTRAAREYIRLAGEYWEENLIPPQKS